MHGLVLTNVYQHTKLEACTLYCCSYLFYIQNTTTLKSELWVTHGH